MLNFVYFLQHQHWTVWDRDLYYNVWLQCKLMENLTALNMLNF